MLRLYSHFHLTFTVHENINILCFIFAVLFARSRCDEAEAQPRTDAFVFVQRIQPRRSDGRVLRCGRIPDVRRLRIAVTGRAVLRIAHSRLVRAPRLIRTAAVRRRTSGGRPGQQTSVRHCGDPTTAGIRTETRRAGRLQRTKQ